MRCLARTERDKFIRFTKIDGITKAEFRLQYPRYFKRRYRSTFALDKIECQRRLDNLEEQDKPHDQTSAAMDSWPTP